MPAQTPNVVINVRIEPGTLGHLDLVEPLRALPDDLRDALAGIRDEEARFRAAPDQWCIKEIVGHLRDAAEVYHQRLYMMSTQTDPILRPYDQDAWVTEHDYLGRPLEQMLDELAEFRVRTVSLLTTLVNWNWARTGQHTDRGRTSIKQLVEYVVEHEAQHLADVRALRAAAAAA